MIAIACITFGHTTEDVERCLSTALALSENDPRMRVITVDDSSGSAPQPRMIPGFTTPSRRGFAATVQYIVEVIAPDCERLVLVNPDAEADVETLVALAASTDVVTVPTIISTTDRAFMENVRPSTTGSREIRNLLFGERRRAFILKPASTEQRVNCPPFAPSGAIISVDAHALRRTPLRAEMFWLEFSDWVLRRNAEGLTTELCVLPNESRHVGASTSVKYPMSVAASQARAKVCFIRDYGSWTARTFAPVAVLSRSLRFAARRRSISSGVFVFQAAMGWKSWMVNA
ncbi:hypothetical protein [Microbacterium sp. P5_E9]